MNGPAKAKEPAAEPVKSFTQEAQELLARAYKEAARLHHRSVRTEHLLIALIDEKQGTATKVLTRNRIDLERLRSQLIDLAEAGSSGRQASGSFLRKLFSTAGSSIRSMLSIPNRLPYTLRVKKALALAMHEARDLGQPNVGVEHILLGVIRERDGNVPRLLTLLGIELETARKAIVAEASGKQ